MKNIGILVTLMTFAGSMMASFSWAKVSDFNTLINENISAQQELHKEIRQQVKTTGQAFRENSNQREDSTVIVESDSLDVNSSTPSKMLKFKKEKKQSAVSRKKQMDRISQEFDDASTSF